MGITGARAVDPERGHLNTHNGDRGHAHLGVLQDNPAFGIAMRVQMAPPAAVWLCGQAVSVAGALQVRVAAAERLLGCTAQWGAIAGDPDSYGRVDVGTNERGLQYGDPS